VNEDEVGGGIEVMRNAYKNFLSANVKGRAHLEDLGVGGETFKMDN
jgi:hypothetical protein